MRVRKIRHRRGGKSLLSKNYYCLFNDHRGHWRRLATVTDKSVADRFAQRLQELVSLRKLGEREPPASLIPWIEALSENVVHRLVKWDILDGRHAQNLVPLTELLDRWRQWMLDQNRSPRHANQQHERVSRIIEGCAFTMFPQIRPGPIESFIASLRQPHTHGTREHPGISAATAGHFATAIKTFTSWCVKQDVASIDPLRSLAKPKVDEADLKRVRRILSDDELERLLSTAEHGPDKARMSGHDRCTVYLLAAELGLRAGEIRRLTPASIHLDDESPHINLRRTKSKKTQRVLIGVDSELIPRLRDKLALRFPADDRPVFRIPNRAADMLRFDLLRAGIEYIDGESRAYDFHALRGQCISSLVRAGVSISELRELARHSSVTTSLHHYARLHDDALRATVNQLPRLKTGTIPAS